LSGLQLTLFGVSHIDTVHSLVHCITLVTYIKSLFVTQFSFYIRFSDEIKTIQLELRKIRLKLQSLQNTLKIGSWICICTLPDATLTLFILILSSKLINAETWCENGKKYMAYVLGIFCLLQFKLLWKEILKVHFHISYAHCAVHVH
jgi:hypothetical protein